MQEAGVTGAEVRGMTPAEVEGMAIRRKSSVAYQEQERGQLETSRRIWGRR